MRSSDPVVLFCAALGGDGVARNTVHLANALARRGAAVEVVCLTGGALEAELLGVRITRLGRTRGPRALALAAAMIRLRRRLLGLWPSVVVSMGNHAHLAVWAALRGLGDTPRIYRLSNDPTHGGGGGVASLLRQASLRLVANDATRLVSVSEAIAQRAPFRRLRRDRRVDVVANGVDASRVRDRAAKPSAHPWALDRKPYLAAVGRLHPQKNYGALIAALARVRAHGHPDMRLLIMGGGPAKRRLALERQAASLGLADAVRFEGEVADPFPLIARAAAYVLPSLWEGASNSLLEALACGPPVVAARTAGSAPETLGHGRYGLLATPDAAGLADAILQQLDPARRVSSADRARQLTLSAAVDHLSEIVLGARAAHDEIQIQAEGQRHDHGLGGALRGPHTEY